MRETTSLKTRSAQVLNQQAMDDEIGPISDECVLNVEMLPFNVLNNEYDNFELRDKIFEKTAAFHL